MRNKKSIAIAAAMILFGIIVAASCTHKPQEVVPTVSFSADIQPILTANCAISSSCHIGANNANDHIDFTDSLAYTTIVSKGLVMTSNASASLLYNEIETGDMPKAPYNKLSATQINLVLYWIQQGALNN